jgi:hypothetical protein
MLQIVPTKPYQPQPAQRVTQTAQEILAAQKEHAEFILSCFETKLELVDDNEGF